MNIAAIGFWMRRVAAGLIASALIGCSTLPTIVPDMSRSNPRPQLSGAKGPLTAARSKEILDQLKSSRPDGNVLDRHLALEQAISDSPLSAGNKVVLLEDGPRTYEAMFAAINAARDHVNMETYILEDDETGRRFADALIAKQRAGVQVNLIRDSVGTLGTKKEFFMRLTEAGIKVLEFNPVNPLEAKVGWDVNQRDHRKLLITDGRVALLGGINISSVYSGGSSSVGSGGGGGRSAAEKQPWRDTDLQVEGPVVAEFQKLFIETWEKQKGEPLPKRQYFPALQPQGDDVVHAIGSTPDDPFSLIYATLISAIDNAEREVLLTNAYFVPDPQLLASLKAAVARGVDVRLVLPGSSDAPLVFHAGRSYYDELLSAGVKIYERRRALLHAKTVLIDGVWSTVGSTNLDWRSFLHNQELNAVVLGAGFGTQMRASFERDVANSEQITLDKWRWRSPGTRAKEAFARVWQYWL
jgi:cardiolipin synthase